MTRQLHTEMRKIFTLAKQIQCYPLVMIFFFLLFVGLFVSMHEAKILYVRSLEELTCYFPSDSEPCFPAGYTVLYFHVFMAPEEYQQFPALFPQFKYHQSVNRFVHGIYALPIERRTVRFPKQPIGSFDENDWSTDDESLDNEDGNKPNASAVPQVLAKPNLNVPVSQPMLNASLVRPYSKADYYDLERFQREVSYQFEEILLTLCIHITLSWNLSYCQNYKLVQYWFDALDFKWIKNIGNFFIGFPNLLPSCLVRQALMHIMSDVFKATSIQKISRESYDWNEFQDKMKNLNAVWLADIAFNSINLIKFENERFFSISFVGISFWKILDEFRRTVHVRSAISYTNIILNFCQRFDRPIETDKFFKAINSLNLKKKTFLESILPSIKEDFRNEKENARIVEFSHHFVDVIVKFGFWRKRHHIGSLDSAAVSTLRTIYLDLLKQFSNYGVLAQILGKNMQHPLFPYAMLMSQILTKCYELVIVPLQIFPE